MGYLVRVLKILALTLLIYFLIAYGTLPYLWRHYEHHPALEAVPKITNTNEGLSGDPLNIALVGTKEELTKAYIAAGWYPADPITLKTSLEIVASVALNRSYVHAPISNMYLFGKKQDFAFELPVSKSPQKRHHVRLWQSSEHSPDGRPLWIGSATYDSRIGFNHYTGQVTHHIAPDIDQERDKFLENLKKANQLAEIYQVTGVGATIQGQNGGGDWYYTDGELTVGVLSKNNVLQTQEPFMLPNPPTVNFKNRVLASMRTILRRILQFSLEWTRLLVGNVGGFFVLKR